MNKLKEKRIENRFKLKDIAEVTGVSFQAVQQWETGETLPSINSLIKLAKFYGCTVDELLTDPREKLEAELQAKIESGEMTADEAEHEYQDRFNPEPRYCGQEW